MEQTQVQLSNVPVSSGSSQIPAVAPVTATVPTNKTRFMNHNFILVPAGSTNLLTNNGQVSNLIATHHNSIVNKGKIMILTTTPTMAQQNAGSSANNIQVVQAVNPPTIANASVQLAPHHQQCVQIRPNLTVQQPSSSSSSIISDSSSVQSFGNTTTATSIIANIKMNPISNQSSAMNQIQQIATVQPAANIVQNSNQQAFVSNKPTTIQMLTPIVSTTNLSSQSYSNNNDSKNPFQSSQILTTGTAPKQVQSTAATIMPSVAPIMMNSSKSNSIPIQTISNHQANKAKSHSILTSASRDSITAPVILNGTNLFFATPDNHVTGNIINITGGNNKTVKPMINLNLLSDGNKSNYTKKNKHPRSTHDSVPNFKPNCSREFNREDDIIVEADLKSTSNRIFIPANKHKNGNLKLVKIFTEETLDRSSPELWPEPVPGVVNFLASTSPSYPIDDDDDDDDNNNDDVNDTTDSKREGDLNKSEPTVPNLNNNDNDNKIANQVINLSAIVKREILDDDEEEEEEYDDMISMMNNNTINNDQPRKLIKSFALTEYGLQSESENDHERKDDDDDDNDNDNYDDDNDNDNNNNDNNDDSRVSSPSECPANQTTVSNNSKKNNHKVEWQKDFNDDELSMLYGFGSLTAPALLEKVREIQNLAYQLGLEGEHEMARGRYLDILRQPIKMEEDFPNLIIDQEIDDIFSHRQTDLPAPNLSQTSAIAQNAIDPMIVT